jgi:hypothetical protein
MNSADLSHPSQVGSLKEKSQRKSLQPTTHKQLKMRKQISVAILFSYFS